MGRVGTVVRGTVAYTTDEMELIVWDGESSGMRFNTLELREASGDEPFEALEIALDEEAWGRLGELATETAEMLREERLESEEEKRRATADARISNASTFYPIEQVDVDFPFTFDEAALIRPLAGEPKLTITGTFENLTLTKEV